MMPPVAKSDLLASLPPKTVVDDLIVKIFRSGEPAIIIFHVPTFMKDYDKFWNDVESLPIAWLGKLFGLLCLATLFERRRGDTWQDPLEVQQEVVDSFRMRAAQCLCMANYTRPGPHKIEALIVYMAAEYFKSKDAQLGVSMVIGIIVRLSMSMGYHRDPDHDSKISVFAAEMIRRRWAFIKQVVGLTSFQMGLPTMIHPCQTDTRPPHNLLDTDFDQSTSILPPERPVQEYTPISYLIAKERMVKAFAMIVDSFNPSRPVPYKGIVQLDMHLQRIRSTFPASFQMHSQPKAGPEPAHIILKRYFLEILYLKGRCVLNRQYLTYATTDVRYSASRSTCLEASRQILRHQAEIFRQTQPGGALSADSWVLLSLTTSDFLLAAMIICLCISRQRQLTNTGQIATELGFPTDDEMIASLMHELGTSQRIWISLSQKSAEAGRAAEAISLMLAQANKSGPFLSMPAADAFSTGVGSERLNPSMDTRTGFDWETWDRYFQLPPPDVPPAAMEAAAAVPADLPFETTLPQEMPTLDEFSDLNFGGSFEMPAATFGMPC
jgi:Fungal specific transcription factor domain